MINSKDTGIIKELVTSSIYQAVPIINKETFKIKTVIEKCFDIVINEMKQGGI